MNGNLAYISYKELDTNYVIIENQHPHDNRTIEVVYEFLTSNLPWVGIKLLIYTEKCFRGISP